MKVAGDVGPPRLRKHLGQHHLRQAELCRPLLEFLQPRGETVVEVGTGGGVLTEALVGAGAEVLTLDLDPAWLLAARRRLAGAMAEGGLTAAGRVRWLAADATRFGWRNVPAGWLVAGNLPYNAATQILRQVLKDGASPRIGFLVQREVGERIMAGPGSRRYGLLSLQVGWWADAEILGRVKPGSFQPPPKVESCFLGLTRRTAPGDAATCAQVMHVAGAAFSQRRKTLANALRGSYRRGDVAAWCQSRGLPTGVRAEQLSLEDFVSLTSVLPAQPRPRR